MSPHVELQDGASLLVSVVGISAARSKFTDEQILAIIREDEAKRKVADVCPTHGITEQTYYRWKAKYGGRSAGLK